jgi:Bacterial Ig domain
MRPPRVFVIAAALTMGAALSTLPAQLASAQPPSTSVLVPSSGATLSGSTYLDASALNATSVEFLLFGGTYGYSAPVVCRATPTYYGWLCSWNTTNVPNGTYVLVSEASGAGGNAFSQVGISINNPPPSTTVIVPADGATLDSAKGFVIDAGASPGVTKVSLHVSVDGAMETLPTTPTIYGWIAVVSPSQPCAQCSAIPAMSTIQSVASYPGGVSGTSPTVNVTIIVYVEIVEP